VHLVADNGTRVDDDAPGSDAWVAALSDSTYYAQPLEPGQRIAMRWPEADAHRLEA
jgi:putative spermidine/putrescine transport system ATP-binding protein